MSDYKERIENIIVSMTNEDPETAKAEFKELANLKGAEIIKKIREKTKEPNE